MAKVLLLVTIRHAAPRRTTMKFDFEISYFFGPTLIIRMVGGKGKTQCFDPSKSIPKFEFSEVRKCSKITL